MDKQTKEARKMAKELPFGKKVAYIWEYYKYWILGGLFIILAIGGTAYSIATRPTYDMEIAYYSEKALTNESIEELESYLENYIEDADGDGEVSVKVYLSSLALLGGDPEANYAIQTRLFAELASGAYPVFLVDGVFYDIVTEGSFSGVMESLRDIKQSPLNQILPSEEQQPLFWCTRALYGPEEGKKKAVDAHDRAVKMEFAIFGERE